MRREGRGEKRAIGIKWLGRYIIEHDERIS